MDLYATLTSQTLTVKNELYVIAFVMAITKPITIFNIINCKLLEFMRRFMRGFMRAAAGVYAGPVRLNAPKHSFKLTSLFRFYGRLGWLFGRLGAF